MKEVADSGNGSRVVGVAKAELIWIRYFDTKEAKEVTELGVLNWKGDVTLLNTKNIVRGGAQKWLSDGVCKRMGRSKLEDGTSLPKNDFQGG